jgi:hypothetical protein
MDLKKKMSRKQKKELVRRLQQFPCTLNLDSLKRIQRESLTDEVAHHSFAKIRRAAHTLRAWSRLREAKKFAEQTLERVWQAMNVLDLEFESFHMYSQLAT